jgi:hypothetical protein
MKISHRAVENQVFTGDGPTGTSSAMLGRIPVIKNISVRFAHQVDYTRANSRSNMACSARHYGLGEMPPYSRWMEARIGTAFPFTLPGLYLELRSDWIAAFSRTCLSQLVTTGSEG